jgi:UDP-glucose 4-epimerase
VNILVTGGAGFVGSHLCDSLVASGHFVTCLDDFSTGSIWNIRHLLDSSHFRLAKGSILDRDLLDKIIRDVEVVYHLAAQVHVDRSYVEPELTYDVNVKGTQNILELCRWHRTKSVIYASTSEVYGTAQTENISENHPLDAPHPYGASKIAADRMCYAYARTFGMPIQIVRCFNLYGPRQKHFGYGGVISLFMRRAMRGEPLIIYGDGKQSRDYTYIADAIAFYRLMLESEYGSGPFNVGTGEDVTINYLASEIISLCDNKSYPVHDKERPSEVKRLCCDNSKAKNAGWRPLTPLYCGLRNLYEWFKSNGTDPR